MKKERRPSTFSDSLGTYYAEQREVSLPPVSVLLLAFHGMQTAVETVQAPLSSSQSNQEGEFRRVWWVWVEKPPLLQHIAQRFTVTRSARCFFEAGIWDFLLPFRVCHPSFAHKLFRQLEQGHTHIPCVCDVGLGTVDRRFGSLHSLFTSSCFIPVSIAGGPFGNPQSPHDGQSA